MLPVGDAEGGEEEAADIGLGDRAVYVGHLVQAGWRIYSVDVDPGARAQGPGSRGQGPGPGRAGKGEECDDADA